MRSRKYIEVRVRIELIISTSFIIFATAIEKQMVEFSYGNIFASFVNDDNSIIKIGAIAGYFLVTGVLEANVSSFEFVQRVGRGMSYVAAFVVTHVLLYDSYQGFVEEAMRILGLLLELFACSWEKGELHYGVSTFACLYSCFVSMYLQKKMTVMKLIATLLSYQQTKEGWTVVIVGRRAHQRRPDGGQRCRSMIVRVGKRKREKMRKKKKKNEG